MKPVLPGTPTPRASHRPSRLLFTVLCALTLAACGGGGGGGGNTTAPENPTTPGGPTNPDPGTTPRPASIPGRLLASNCFQCHGTGGGGGFENIRGEADEIREFLGKPAGSNIMAAHAQGYTPEQINAIVAYFKSGQ